MWPTSYIPTTWKWLNGFQGSSIWIFVGLTSWPPILANPSRNGRCCFGSECRAWLPNAFGPTRGFQEMWRHLLWINYFRRKEIRDVFPSLPLRAPMGKPQPAGWLPILPKWTDTGWDIPPVMGSISKTVCSWKAIVPDLPVPNLYWRIPRSILQYWNVPAGGLLRAGLGFHYCDVGIVTNVEADHLGLKGIHTVEQLAKGKKGHSETVLPMVTPSSNADDDLVYDMRRTVSCNVALFSMDEDNPRIQAPTTTWGYHSRIWKTGSSPFVGRLENAHHESRANTTYLWWSRHLHDQECFGSRAGSPRTWH